MGIMRGFVVVLFFSISAQFLLLGLCKFGNQRLLSIASYLGCYVLCAAILLVAMSWVTILLKYDADKSPPILFLALAVIFPAVLAWPVHELIHRVFGEGFIAWMSEYFGCFFFFIVAFAAPLTLWERWQTKRRRPERGD